jgi:hypothetical protein
MIYNQTEYAAFREIVVRHFAHLVDVSSRYTAKLLHDDREWFFEQALNLAWERRKGFNPSRQVLTLWWSDICRDVALSRTTWTVLTITGDKIVKGKHLHLWGLGCNGDWYDTI